MKRKKSGAPAPPPAKRGQRRKYEQEVDPETGEPLSMETRARRARELVQLRAENEALKRERSDFLSKIETLSSTLVALTKDEPAEVVAEHQVLQREIALHTEFLQAFQSVLDEEAQTETKTKRALYAQGAEAAHSFFLGMLSKSLRWNPASPPASVDIPLQDLTFRYEYASEVFGKQEGKKRLSLRLDAFVPKPATAETVQTLFFRALCNHSDMQRLYGASQSVNVVPMDVPDENTRLLYFRRRASGDVPDDCDQYSVFICNRSVQIMTKSSLVLAPSAPTGSSSSSSSNPHPEPVYGTAKAFIVAMTTTTMFPNDVDPAMSYASRGRPPPNNAQAVPVSGMIVKGVIAWDDSDSDGVRLVVIFSVPEDYKILNSLTFQDLVHEPVDTTSPDLAPPSSAPYLSSSSSAGADLSDDHSSSSSKKKKGRRGGDAYSVDSGGDASASGSNSASAALQTRMTEKFARVLVRVAQEFTLMMAETVPGLGSDSPHGAPPFIPSI